MWLWAGAELGQRGEIKFDGLEFRSPSAFSVYVKRLINPNRKGGRSWGRASLEGARPGVARLLEHAAPGYLCLVAPPACLQPFERVDEEEYGKTNECDWAVDSANEVVVVCHKGERAIARCERTDPLCV